MALGSVIVSDYNSGGGDFTQTEMQFLYIGHAGKNAGATLYIDQTSDLDALLGLNPSKMKTAIHFARQNADANWTCIAMPQNAAGQWAEGFNQALDQDLVCEAVVITDPLSDELTEARQTLADLHAAAERALAAYGRRLFFLTGCRTLNDNETWDEYVTAIKAITDGISAYRVGVVSEPWPGFLGSMAGRLCISTVSIADSPMRVATGTLVGIAELPQDASGQRWNASHAKALSDARITVPTTYTDYAGIYTSDCMLLDTEAGDFQVVEHLRPVDKAARRVRVLAIKKIADRSLNSSGGSIAAHQAYFARPLNEMSKTSKMNGVTLPGDVKPPKSGDIVITWPNNTAVNIRMQVTPYNSPKSIAVGIGLNMNGETA